MPNADEFRKAVAHHLLMCLWVLSAIIIPQSQTKIYFLFICELIITLILVPTNNDYFITQIEIITQSSWLIVQISVFYLCYEPHLFRQLFRQRAPQQQAILNANRRGG